MLLTKCISYRGKNGFRRKDHLRQHIRKYHRMEDYELSGLCQECYFTYTSLEELADHMLQKHQSSAYLCIGKGCDRTGMNGFASGKELKAHVREDHSSTFQCSFLGCDRIGTKGWIRERDMDKHMEKKHG